MRLGGMETLRVDVRIIAATNIDLRKMVEDGRFREDLFYRLNVIAIELPPLRDRMNDIPLLAQHFLTKYGEENGKPGLELSPEALDLMMDYDWPGNVRELENVIERAVVLCNGRRIGEDLIPDHVRRTAAFHLPDVSVPPEGISFKEVITDFEKRLIESTLEAAGGVQKRAAELLHIKPTTLNEMIKRYDIRPRRRKGPRTPTARPRPPLPSHPLPRCPRPAASPPARASSAPAFRREPVPHRRRGRVDRRPVSAPWPALAMWGGFSACNPRRQRFFLKYCPARCALPAGQPGCPPSQRHLTTG